MSGRILSSKERLNIIHKGSEITDLMLATKELGIPCVPVLVVAEFI